MEPEPLRRRKKLGGTPLQCAEGLAPKPRQSGVAPRRRRIGSCLARGIVTREGRDAIPFRRLGKASSAA